MGLEQEIKSRATELGFDAVGITDASPIGAEHIEHFEAWLRSGYAGCMDYLRRNLEKRTSPANLLQGARSVIVVALNYKPSELMIDEGLLMIGGEDGPVGANHRSSIIHNQCAVGRVAQYAQYEDYHRFIKSRLHELVDFLRREIDADAQFKVCVDSAPLAEKALAVRAGLGFIGKNHLLIHPQLGPQILLGEIVTTLTLRPEDETGMVEQWNSGIMGGRGAPSAAFQHSNIPLFQECIDPCAGCNRCIQACPTGALREDGFLDARRCISYLTKHETGDDSLRGIGDWLFGCDECLLACPRRHSAPARKNHAFRHYPERAKLDLHELLELSPEAFKARFHDSPMVRRELALLKRNARICLENHHGLMKDDG